MLEIPRITVSLPCFGRPERTKRSIECILNQNINNWEAFIIGDCCPDFQELINNGYLEKIKQEQLKLGNIIHYFNANERGGGCGYKLTNYAIKNASGKYFIFYANDDIILSNHFENYLEIENTDLDYMYFNSWVDPIQNVRDSKMGNSQIGHSEIILKTELAKKLPIHSPKYGHDWEFINEMSLQSKGKKSNKNIITYKVMSVPSLGTKDVID